jgi:nucleotide-binding universal stress UspA family protein
MILIAYDGSQDAKVAIEQAGKLLSPQPTTVLTVWQPFANVIAHTATFDIAGAPAFDTDQIDQESRNAAVQRAREGVQLAQQAGLGAEPCVVAQETTTAEAILSEANRIDADAIVLGSRGLTGLKSLLLGSVSHAVIQHAERTVIVVPSPRVAGARQRQRTGRAEA